MSSPVHPKYSVQQNISSVACYELPNMSLMNSGTFILEFALTVREGEKLLMD